MFINCKIFIYLRISMCLGYSSLNLQLAISRQIAVKTVNILLNYYCKENTKQNKITTNVKKTKSYRLCIKCGLHVWSENFQYEIKMPFKARLPQHKLCIREDKGLQVS